MAENGQPMTSTAATQGATGPTPPASNVKASPASTASTPATTNERRLGVDAGDGDRPLCSVVPATCTRKAAHSSFVYPPPCARSLNLSLNPSPSNNPSPSPNPSNPSPNPANNPSNNSSDPSNSSSDPRNNPSQCSSDPRPPAYSWVQNLLKDPVGGGLVEEDWSSSNQATWSGPGGRSCASGIGAVGAGGCARYGSLNRRSSRLPANLRLANGGPLQQASTARILSSEEELRSPRRLFLAQQQQHQHQHQQHPVNISAFFLLFFYFFY